MKKDVIEEDVKPEDCFIIMPIADAEGYENGHFRRVYHDLLKPACEIAGYNAVRADDVKQTNLIHLDILEKLISSPMAICDLSNRNPNVLFELGLRQAFDKPTILIQEEGTPRIFDISMFRYTEYRNSLRYREVLEDQNYIADALKETKIASSNNKGINSIISLLSLSKPASLKEVSDNDNVKFFQVIMSEMNLLRSDINKVRSRTVIDNSSQEVLVPVNSHLKRLSNLYNNFAFSIEAELDYSIIEEHYRSFINAAEDLEWKNMNPNTIVKLNKIHKDAERLFDDFRNKLIK